MQISKPIFLIGLPGVGKTYAGERMAKTLNIPFIDSDEKIKKKFNLKHAMNVSISEIILTHGALYFRKLEREFLKELQPKPQIVACGGGLPCFFDNIDILKRMGIVVWLTLDIETIINHIALSKNERPMFAGKNKGEVCQILHTLLRDRKYFYEQAHFVIASQNGNVHTKLLETIEKKYP